MKKLLLGIAIILFIIAGLWYRVSYLSSHPTDNDRGSTTNKVEYICAQNKTITATYSNHPTTTTVQPGQPPIPTGEVGLILSDGRTLTLAQTISADGTRYANPDESFVFWSKGNGALVLENNQEESSISCMRVANERAGESLPQPYANSWVGFSLRLPSLATATNSFNGFQLDESYHYDLTPTEKIFGIKFNIPTALATGTNLSNDSYLSIERLPKTLNCSANLFLSRTDLKNRSATENDTTYSVASSTDAAAGNRYEEIIYALPDTNPCVAVRYFIHSTVFENYPTGTIGQFDRQALLKQFDAIRHSLVINQ